MLKDLVSSVLSSEGSDFLKQVDLSPANQEKALDLAKDSMLDGLKESAVSGNFGEITKAFSDSSSSSLVESITSSYGAGLVSKLGFNDTLSKTISTKLIPMVFDFIQKNDTAPTDDEDGVKDLVSDLIGGGIQDKIGGMLKSKFKL